jgi:hypothetical protein
MNKIAVLFGILFLSGCSTPKPDLPSYHDVGVEGARFIYCVERGAISPSMGAEFRTMISALMLHPYTYDKDLLNQEIREKIRIVKSSNHSLSSICSSIPTDVAQWRRRVELNRRNAAQREATIAQMMGVLNSMGQSYQQQGGYVQQDFYIPSVNSYQSGNNNTQNYLINGEGGFQRRTCTGNGSYRYCF